MRDASDLPAEIAGKFSVFDWRNAIAILASVHQSKFDEILTVLGNFDLKHSFVAKGGGNKSKISRYIDEKLGALGWVETGFDTEITVDGMPNPSPTHKIDCYKDKVALEVEWNNKDPFFDRDLNYFRLLYDLRVIDVGIIVTRDTSLETVLGEVGRSKTTYGKATTHTEKLYPKIQGGGAGGCPVLVFGITSGAYIDDR
ncbi:MAG: BglII/BstYI family type II restriction endonuclease [Ahrensia sp.]|nr:BglII/BstYI family type II restriction endonuclease [Ahrensia sp.]